MRDYRSELRTAFARLPADWTLQEHEGEDGTPYATLDGPTGTIIVTPSSDYQHFAALSETGEVLFREDGFEALHDRLFGLDTLRA